MEEINEVMKMPTGFRFRPSEVELINYYLKPKNLEQPLPCNIVQEKPLYSGDPWRVLDVNDQENKWQVSETYSRKETDSRKVTKMTIYVFTKLAKKKHATGAGGRKKEVASSGGREKFVRAAGCGTWDGQTGPKEIKNVKGEVIGFRKTFIFEIGNLNPGTSTTSAAETNNPGHYIMYEYSLPGSEWEYVLCEITLILKNSSKKGKSSENLEEHSVRKSSSPRVEFGTTYCEGDVGVNNYMEVVTHPFEVSIPESSSRNECGSNGEDDAGTNCNYMEVVPQPLAAIDQLYGEGGQPAAVEYYNELGLMMIEEIGSNQIQQPLAAFEYVNGRQYQANDEQLMMLSDTGICGNYDNQIQQPLAATDYGNGGQYDQLMMMSHTGIWSNDDGQNQQWDDLLSMEELFNKELLYPDLF